MQSPIPQANTMNLSAMANLVLDCYMQEHPELGKHAKGSQGSAAIIREIFPKLSRETRSALEKQYPELKKYN